MEFLSANAHERVSFHSFFFYIIEPMRMGIQVSAVLENDANNSVSTSISWFYYLFFSNLPHFFVLVYNSVNRETRKMLQLNHKTMCIGIMMPLVYHFHSSLANIYQGYFLFFLWLSSSFVDMYWEFICNFLYLQWLCSFWCVTHTRTYMC